MCKITKIEVQKNNNQRVNIFVDDNFAFAFNIELVYKLGLKKGEIVDTCKIEELLLNEDFLKCKNYALRVVTKGYKTEKEIRGKLAQKDFHEKSVEKTVDFLKEYNFIDDVKFAYMFSKDKSYNQGRNKIKYKLKQKGIADDIIEESLNSLDEDIEYNKALELGKKNYSILIKRQQDKFKLHQKVCSYLIGRGYDYSLVKKVVNKIILEMEEEL